VLAKKLAKPVAALDELSIGEVAKVPGGSDGSTGPSIKALGPPEEVDPIDMSFDLSP
jgi:hypothetical protein